MCAVFIGLLTRTYIYIYTHIHTCMCLFIVDTFSCVLFLGCLSTRADYWCRGRPSGDRLARLGANDCTPEINTSEIIVNCQRHFPTASHCSVICMFQRIVTFPMDFQWHFLIAFHFFEETFGRPAREMRARTRAGRPFLSRSLLSR